MPLRAHLQLILRIAFPRVHKGREVVGEFVVRRQDWENLRVGTVQKFDCVREGAVAAILVNSQEPNDGRQQDNRRLDEEIALLLHQLLFKLSMMV